MCRKIVIDMLWDDEHPEDVGFVFNHRLNHDQLDPGFEKELTEFLERRFFGDIRIEVKPYHGVKDGG